MDILCLDDFWLIIYDRDIEMIESFVELLLAITSSSFVLHAGGNRVLNGQY